MSRQADHTAKTLGKRSAQSERERARAVEQLEEVCIHTQKNKHTLLLQKCACYLGHSPRRELYALLALESLRQLRGLLFSQLKKMGKRGDTEPLRIHAVADVDTQFARQHGSLCLVWCVRAFRHVGARFGCLFTRKPGLGYSRGASGQRGWVRARVWGVSTLSFFSGSLQVLLDPSAAASIELEWGAFFFCLFFFVFVASLAKPLRKKFSSRSHPC
jgi:hypothetical protein